MTFADRCVHCEHYHEKTGPCCYCKKDPNAMEKTRAQHLAELEDENEIDLT